MTLGDLQRIFVPNCAKLVMWTYGRGWELTDGEAYRTKEQAAINALGKEGRVEAAWLLEPKFPMLAQAIRLGTSMGVGSSAHTQRLARDWNLFINGIYQTDSEVYRPLGEFWKTLHPLNRWGGDFRPRPDGNHFSMEHGGVK